MSSNSAGNPTRPAGSIQARSNRETILRKSTRRSFTVEIKQSPSSGRTFIPAKPRQGFDGGKRSPDPASALRSVFEPRGMPASGASKAKEVRRILPSLIAWEPSTPEPELKVSPEAPLPRVRRVARLRDADVPPLLTDELRTAAPEAEAVSVAQPAPLFAHDLVPAQSMPVTITRADRSARAEAAVLPRAERWKRRLPRACW